MKYRVTCLTPTLIGDGQKLAPIDYMVWKDHVNVLDQRRIFRLLAKGPRLDGYLVQLKKADKLDFASWGGFAQNFAGRRIPFEHPSAIPLWERAKSENLFIPTFACSPAGPYLPATAIKGALRTGTVFDRWTEATMAMSRTTSRKIVCPEIQPQRLKMEPWASRIESSAARGGWRFEPDPARKHESVFATCFDFDRSGIREVRIGMEVRRRGPWMRAGWTTALRLSRKWPYPGRRSRVLGRSGLFRIGAGCSRLPTATPPALSRAIRLMLVYPALGNLRLLWTS